MSVLESDVTGAVNIASGQPAALKDVVCRIGERLGREDFIRLETMPSPPNDPLILTASVKRISGEVGWKPRYSLYEGIDRTIEWWKEVRKGTTGNG